MKRFLLDTGMLVGLAKGTSYAVKASSEHNLSHAEVSMSVVCKGEILAIAEKHKWGQQKRSDLEEILNRFPILNIRSKKILNAYAKIDAWSQGTRLNYPDYYPLLPPDQPKKMGKNDLWIAATAHVNDLVLLSTDTDFLHLHDKWIDFVHIDPKNN